MSFLAISVTSLSFRPEPPETAIVTTGAASRLNFSTTGGSVPKGSRGRSVETLSRTSCAAMSPLRSSLKPMTTVETPSRVVERSSSMPETVLTASSTGLVTDDSTSSTLAPRSVVVTTTTGTSTFGNNSTPSRAYDARPSTTGPMTSMVVNTGRRMQMSQIDMNRCPEEGVTAPGSDSRPPTGSVRS
jgi:hypothetical protein